MEINTIKNYNILVMSVAFMMVFTGFNTMSGIQVIVLADRIAEEIMISKLLLVDHDLQVSHDSRQWRLY